MPVLNSRARRVSAAVVPIGARSLGPVIGEDGAETWVTGPQRDTRRYSVTADDLASPEIGGEGLVYRAHATRSGEEVALKLLTMAAEDGQERLRQRADLFVGIDHPNLMSHIEAFSGPALTTAPETTSPEDFDVNYVVSRWIAGRSLAQAIDRTDRPRMFSWIVDVARGLAHLHGSRGPATPMGIVHRDVKPSNVRIATDDRAVLIDFGVARPVQHDDMTAGIGTYRWRAPETLSDLGPPTGTASDVWGLGAVAHWMLVGEPPALDGAAASRKRIAEALRGHPRRAAIAGHISSLLHSSPDDRPSDLGAWASRFVRLTNPVSAHRRRSAAAALTVAALAAAVAVAFLPAGQVDEAGARTTGSPAVLVRGATTVAGPSTTVVVETTVATAAPPSTTEAAPTTGPVTPTLDPTLWTICTTYALPSRQIAYYLEGYLVPFRRSGSARSAFGEGLVDGALIQELHSLGRYATEVGLLEDGQVLLTADAITVRALTVAWLWTAGDGSDLDQSTIDAAIAFASSQFDPGSPTSAPTPGDQLRALSRIVRQFLDAGCPSELWKSPRLINPSAGDRIRQATGLDSFYDQFDQLQGDI